MDTKSQQQKRRDATLSSLNTAIEVLNLAKEASGMTPAKAVFGSVSILLTMIKDSMANRTDYVELGLACADVCKALDRGMNGRQLDELNRSVFEAIEQLTAIVAEIQGNIAEKSGRNMFSRLVHAKNDKEVMTAWRSDLNRVLHVFNTELAINTHMMVADIHRNALTGQGSTAGQDHSAQSSTPLGELPPPPPRACFGRDELIEKVIDLAENLTPIALIGAGGIGKTSVALAVLHHNRIKERFGDNRWFVRCDQFPASRANFLGRLSTTIGANIRNPEDLIPLRPYLSSKEMFITLDNAESILDPRGTNAQEIYAVVEELCQFDKICLCITSRITTIPLDCKYLDVPTLSLDAARSTFYRIYDNDERADLIDNILEQLDFHPLSVTLLATVGQHNKWDNDRLTREWEQRQTDVLQTEHNRSLAATIELSLASPLFQELGPDARDLLGVVAFFPQGINEDNLDWLFTLRIPFSGFFSTILNRPFPTISERKTTFDKFCILSLTYRNSGFITMLAPLRDYLGPKNPESSPLLRLVKNRYFRRLSVDLDLENPGFKEARWIIPEDTNVEHLLDVFTSIHPTATHPLWGNIWSVCAHFMKHLFWHKPRLVALGPKIEGLPDDHPSKPECLSALAQLFQSVGNEVERRRLLTHTLKLERGRGDCFMVAWTLERLSDSNRYMGLHKEGIQLVKEALEVYERLGDTVRQAKCLIGLALLLYGDEQLGPAEEAASRATRLLPEKGEQFLVCNSHRVLGHIHQSKGETKKAIDCFETILKIASSFDWHDQLFWGHYNLAQLALGEGRFDDAHGHIGRAKSHTVNNPYKLCRAMEQQAGVWHKQHRLEEARSEALRATDVYEKLGAATDLERCRKLLRDIEEELNGPVASGSTACTH